MSNSNNNNNIIAISKTQLFAIMAMSAISLAAIVIGVISGIEDRAIIKIRVTEILGNISEAQDQILHFETTSEERSQRLLPPFEAFINNSATMVNQSAEMVELNQAAYDFWTFLRTNFDETYLTNEYRQYEQSNITNATMPKIIELLRDINSSLT